MVMFTGHRKFGLFIHPGCQPPTPFITVCQDVKGRHPERGTISLYNDSRILPGFVTGYCYRGKVGRTHRQGSVGSEVYLEVKYYTK